MIEFNKNSKNYSLKIYTILKNFNFLKLYKLLKHSNTNTNLNLNLFKFIDINYNFNLINLNKFFIFFYVYNSNKSNENHLKSFKINYFSSYLFNKYEFKNNYVNFFNFNFFNKKMFSFYYKKIINNIFLLKKLKLKKLIYFYSKCLKLKKLNFFKNLKKLKNMFIFVYRCTCFNFFISLDNLYFLNIKIKFKNIDSFFLLNFIKYKIYFSRFFLSPKNDFSVSNKYFLNINLINFNDKINNSYYLNVLNLDLKYNSKLYNNYYPVLSTTKKVYNIFFSNFKLNFNNFFLKFNNKIVLSSIENLINKKFFIKVTNNYFNDINNYYYNIILNDYKFYRNILFKDYSVVDFIRIIWYSFYFKDLTLISNWVTVFMESLNFKNHKKFISFFNNFLNKYYNIFVSILRIKGFFFDIRGKVGVTGSSKKRHFYILIGNINKSSKKCKIDFNQNLVRTYSGVMGLTYILNY